MSDTNGPQRIVDHVAVPLGEYILVFGGKFGTFQKDSSVSHDIIWMYNLYTEQWRKHRIPESELCPPHTLTVCAVAIKEDVFKFGGFNFSHGTYSSELWKLSKSSKELLFGPR